MTLPEQIAEVPADREARAPYNFVPLPNKVVPAEQQEPVDQSVYDPDRHTGTITCNLKTAAPLYVRCGYAPEDFAEFGDKRFDKINDAQARERRAQFFHLKQPEQPVIPGSSLRGMLRSLVEIASYGKMDKVTDRGLVYRAVGDRTSLGEQYRDRFLKNEGSKTYSFLMSAGYMRNNNGNWTIIPAQTSNDGTTFSRIERSAIPRNLSAWQSTRTCFSIYVKTDPIAVHHHNKNHKGGVYLKYSKVSVAAAQSRNGLQEGVLVKTGTAPRKHMEFVFNCPDDISKAIEVEDNQIIQYRDQISQGQEQLIGKEGVLSHMHPVFYLVENGRLVFFGHAMMFRLPYLLSPANFVPDNIRYGQSGTKEQPKIDIAEALFGFVPHGKSDKRSAVAGRVFVSDAQSQQHTLLNEQSFAPRILSSPKPTTFQHYLVQTDSKSARQNLKHYASKPYQEEADEKVGKGIKYLQKTAVIRGHKLYWHRGDVGYSEIVDQDFAKVLQEKQKQDTQHTWIKPLAPEATFIFTVRFENLSNVELGALLWVLRLAADERYRLKLGMGKPLGMGAVQIASSVQTNKRTERYQSLFADNNWELAEAEMIADDQQQCISAFEEYVLCESGEKGQDGGGVVRLEDTLRIRCLLTLLSWPGPSDIKTQYQSLEEFKARPVLPRPDKVLEAGQNTSQETQNMSTDAGATVLGKIIASGSMNATVQADNGVSGRANYASNTVARAKVGQRVRCKVDADGKPTIIIAFE